MKVDEGFRAMYEREFPSVYRAASMLCGDPSLAEDATQEAFARALARWRRLSRQPWVAGWVTTTALNVARRQMRSRPALPPQPAEVPDREAELDLLTGIRALPSRQQEAIALFYLVDLTVVEAAAVMGCDVGTVKTHLARARATLARVLRDGDDEPSDPRSRGRA